MREEPALLMFFYGTLKRGHANHDPFCRGALFVREATVRGQLYDLPFGYPALVVPEGDVLAIGTAAPLRDAAEQRRLGREHGERLPGSGPRVFGELFAFHDPAVRLPALDRLEGFDPEDGSSSYRRASAGRDHEQRLHPGLGLRGRGGLQRSPAGREMADLAETRSVGRRRGT